METERLQPPDSRGLNHQHMNHSQRFIGGKKVIIPVLTRKGKKGSSTKEEGKRKHINSNRNYGQGS